MKQDKIPIAKDSKGNLVYLERDKMAKIAVFKIVGQKRDGKSRRGMSLFAHQHIEKLDEHFSTFSERNIKKKGWFR